MKVKFLFIVAVFFFSNSFAQINNLKFDRITVEEGLSQNSVHSILQDSYGFLWIGTLDGLNKYDGYEFKEYRCVEEIANTLSNNSITAIIEDRERNLWIGTSDGLNRYNRETNDFTRFKKNDDDQNSIGNNDITTLCFIEPGILWIGTRFGGLHRYDLEKNRFSAYTHNLEDSSGISAKSIDAVFRDSDKVLWIGTRGDGLFSYNKKTDRFKKCNQDPENDNINKDNIYDICEDDLNNLLLGTGNGLIKYNKMENSFIRYSSINKEQEKYFDYVHSVIKTRTGSIWAGTNNSGLLKYDKKTGNFIQYSNNPHNLYSISSNTINSLYEDRTGILWIGTYAGGLNKLSQDANKFSFYQNSADDPQKLSNNKIRAIFEDRSGLLWVGDDGGGLVKYDRKNRKMKYYQYDKDDPGSLSDNSVSVIFEDRDGDFWIGTKYGGLNKFNKYTGKFVRNIGGRKDSGKMITSKILSIYEDRSGKLWIGTKGAGLYLLIKKTGKLTQYRYDRNDPLSLSNNCIWAMHEDDKGKFWLGTSAGLNSLDRETGVFSRYIENFEHKVEIGKNIVLTIWDDKKGLLWLGTYGGGIIKFNRQTGASLRLREKDNLPNDVIYGILGDNEGCLWLSTNRGLARFYPLTETFNNYTTKDGLQSSEFNSGAYFKSQSGELFFGGVNGLNTFFPAEIKKDHIPPQVAITEFLVLNESVIPGDNSALKKDISVAERIELEYKKQVFTFKFSALHFASPGKNQYAYILEGYDEDWNYVGNRPFATYTGIPPGDYVFRVKASNKDNVWNEVGTSVKIVIKPPLWLNKWFRILMAGSIFIFLFFLYKIRIRMIEKQKIKLKEIVDERTAQLNEEREGLVKINQVMQQEMMERNKAEKALKESEKRYRTIFNQASDAIIIENERMEIFDANLAACHAFGYTREELLKMKTSDLQAGKYPSLDIYSNPDKILEKPVERKALKKNGEMISVELSISTIKTNNNTLFISSARDITSRKEAESESLRREKMQGILEMAGGVSHELSQPMQVALGYAEFLLSDKPDSNKGENQYLVMIKESIFKMSEITKKLQNITKYETIDYLRGRIVDIDRASDVVVD